MASSKDGGAGLLYSIQALRGLGAVAVVISHVLTLNPLVNFRAGAAGVDLFFVISGIVMALSIREGVNARSFFLRRVVRVVPLYWFMTGLTVLYVYVAHSGSVVGTEVILRSLLFLRPVDGSMPLLYPGWSLNYEMLFYTTLTVFIFFGKYCLPLAIGLFLLLGSLSSIEYFNAIYFIKYYLLEFSIGLIIGCGFKQKIQINTKVGYIFISISLILFAFHNHFQSSGFVAWGIPSVLMIVGFYAFDDGELLKSKIVQEIGDASYSIYLVHPFVIWACERIPKEGRGWSILVIAILLSIIFGIVVHRWVEKPLLKFSLKFVPR